MRIMVISLVMMVSGAGMMIGYSRLPRSRAMTVPPFFFRMRQDSSVLQSIVCGTGW